MTWTYVERNEDYVVFSFYKVCSDEMRKKGGCFFLHASPKPGSNVCRLGTHYDVMSLTECLHRARWRCAPVHITTVLYDTTSPSWTGINNIQPNYQVLWLFRIQIENKINDLPSRPALCRFHDIHAVKQLQNPMIHAVVIQMELGWRIYL